MIKVRTPQEWANITGLHIAQDEIGYWHGFKEKPICHTAAWGYGMLYLLDIAKELVDWEGDWKDSLHSPQDSKPEELTGHHSEYVLIEEPKKERKIVDYNISRASDVREFLQDGWELYGNPFIDAGGCIMQVIIKRK